MMIIGIQAPPCRDMSSLSLLTFISESIVVADEVLLDLGKVIKALKDGILEDSVELVLETGKNGGGLEGVNSHFVEGGVPSDFLEIE